MYFTYSNAIRPQVLPEANLRLAIDQMNFIKLLVKKIDENLILIGDLNMTPTSRRFNKFLKEANLYTYTSFKNPTSTWPSFLPKFLGIQIDHVLFSKNFKVIASSESAPFAGMANEEKGFYGVQFHPEVTHTIQGQAIISRFLTEICQCSTLWTSDKIIQVRVLTAAARRPASSAPAIDVASSAAMTRSTAAPSPPVPDPAATSGARTSTSTSTRAPPPACRTPPRRAPPSPRPAAAPAPPAPRATTPARSTRRRSPTSSTPAGPGRPGP